MMRLVSLILLLLAACVPRTPSPQVGGTASVPSVCRIGPDGARPLADRGIGGTGKPTAQAALQTEVQTADRGIGGTGIIGVVTGFASLCVAGEEIALPEGLPVHLDDHAGGIDDLRAGQVTATTAQYAAGHLRARAIEVLHLVIGPVDGVAGGLMVVAGQRIDPSGAIGSGVGARPGQWVAVSGLRQPDGPIVATRIDPATPGQVLVRGELVRVYGATRIGTLPVRLPDSADLPGGWSAVVTGQLQSGVLVADTARLDIAGESPSAYFGPSVSSYVIESYSTVVDGGYLVDRDFVSGTAFGAVGSRGRRILSFERGADGRLSSGGAPRSAFLPAPLPGGSSSPAGAGQDDGFRPSPRPPPGGPPHR